MGSFRFALRGYTSWQYWLRRKDRPSNSLVDKIHKGCCAPRSLALSHTLCIWNLVVGSRSSHSDNSIRTGQARKCGGFEGTLFGVKEQQRPTKAQLASLEANLFASVNSRVASLLACRHWCRRCVAAAGRVMKSAALPAYTKQ